MDTADPFLELAESCHMMGLATNNPKWHSLARRWLRHAATTNPGTDASPPHEIAEGKKAAVAGHRDSNSIQKVA
jgi:hypothetical protein